MGQHCPPSRHSRGRLHLLSSSQQTRLGEGLLNFSKSKPILQIHQSDLEIAVRRSIYNEVATKDMDQEKLGAFSLYLQAIINFLPNLRPELRNYLVSLRAWADHMRDTKAVTNNITNDETMAKVKESLEQYKPFENNPKGYAEAGCLGSKSSYRGYPCSLWTLFHTLMASAAEKVLLMALLELN